MKILLIMDPGISIPPPLYGGHERLVYLFAEEYKKMGHEVTLLAGPDSKISGKAYSFGINKINRSKFQKNKELLSAWLFLIKHRHQFDLIHNFGRLLYLLPILNHPVKKTMTYGRPVSPKGIRFITNLPHQNLIFTACSNYCVSTGNVAGTWKTVYNSIDFSNYQLKEQVAKNAPLMFLGRLDKVKGVHTAIEIARKANNQLWVGGNIPHTPDNYKYFKEKLEPQFDGQQIIYLGALNDEQKNLYLSQVKAVLFPIEWNEPFGIVMIEAMACGTPVIAFPRGAVPEIVKDGITGYHVQNIDEAVEKISKIHLLDRKLIRQEALQRFDSKVIARQYLELYQKHIENQSLKLKSSLKH